MNILTIAAIDEYLSRNGQFALLDWLIEQNIIAYADYEAWRYGQRTTLDGALSMDDDAINALTTTMIQHCRALKLQCENAEYFPWDGQHQKPLTVSANSSQNQYFCQRWTSSKDLPQMDLFMDNSAAIAENHIIAALADRQFLVADQQLSKLTELNPSHPKLGNYLDLVNYGNHIDQNIDVDIADMAMEIAGLEAEVGPLAGELLGVKKRDFLAFAWRRLANNLASVAFAEAQPNAEAQPKCHASYAFAQIPDWVAVQDTLLAKPEDLQHPDLLLRLAEGFHFNQKSGECYWTWGMAFERFAKQAEQFLGDTQHPHIVQYWDDFLAFDDTWPEAAFLGYLLIRQPGLAHLADAVFATTGLSIVAEFNQTVLALLRTRIAEGNEKIHREHLQRSCPALLRFYLNKRDWYASMRKLR